MRYVLLLLLLTGCSGAESVSSQPFSQQDLAQIKPGMTIAETEAILGKDYTIILAIGDQKACQWIKGEGDAVSSINVRFQNDKVQEVSSSNLK